MKHRVRILSSCALGLAWLAVAHAADGDPHASFAEGMVAYENGHYAEAAARFRRAAEAGDARSSEILTFMYRFGPSLYPAGLPADRQEAAKWAAIAAEARWRDANEVASRAPREF